MDRQLTSRSDEDLLRTYRAEPESEFARAAASALLERYQRRVYLWCYRYVREPERARDLAQEVLLSAWRSLGTFEGRARFSTWIFIVTRNRCINAVVAPRILVDESIDPDSLPQGDNDPAKAYEAHEAEETVQQLIATHLDESERQVLWLRCFERMPVETITSVMHLENTTGARALLQRARRRLRAVLARTADQKGADA